MISVTVSNGPDLFAGFLHLLHRIPKESLYLKRFGSKLQKTCDVSCMLVKCWFLKYPEPFLSWADRSLAKLYDPRNLDLPKTGYFEDPTSAIQVQTLPLEGPSLGLIKCN